MDVAPALDAARQAGREAPLWAWTIAEASGAMRDGRVTPLELVDAHLARIEAMDPLIHAFIHVDADGARDAAAIAGREMAAGRRLGPLHGIPYAVKDNYDVAGLPATAGSRLRLGHVPAEDAELVRTLRQAGAICLGKLSTWEYGTGNGGEYFDLPFPPARNPWDTERYTGGSSTGAGAAVAAGLVKFALGSDTTGSVRLPAAATGTVGIISTAGRLSLDGILPNCWSLDVPGLFAWTAADAATVLSALAGEAAIAAPAGDAFQGLRVGVVRDLGEGFPAPDPELVAALEAGLEVMASRGALVSDLALPVPAAECFAVTRLIGPAESAAIHEAELRERPGEMGFALRDKLLAGSLVRAVDYINAQRRRRDIAGSVAGLLRGVDLLVTFGALRLPPRLGVEPEMTEYTVETALTPFNLSGHPALVQCNGFSRSGLPLHWQMIANHHDEARLLAASAAFERATDWPGRRPEPKAAPPRPVASPPAGAPDGASEVAAFARRHGLERLAEEHRARLAALADPVSRSALALPRPQHKTDRPAPVFEVAGIPPRRTSQGETCHA